MIKDTSVPSNQGSRNYPLKEGWGNSSLSPLTELQQPVELCCVRQESTGLFYITRSGTCQLILNPAQNNFPYFTEEHTGWRKEELFLAAESCDFLEYLLFVNVNIYLLLKWENLRVPEEVWSPDNGQVLGVHVCDGAIISQTSQVSH